MKYVILHGDGMGDWPIESLGNRTPLEAACTPNLDRLARVGELGLLHTIPEGLPPGSDVGSLTLFGFNPRDYYTGRSPIEAASMGIELGDEDVAFRCNLVTIEETSGEETSGEPVMIDFTAGHITTEEARVLIEAVQKALGGEGIEFHPGVSYRHCMVWRNGLTDMTTTPPHDISDRGIEPYLPAGNGAERLNVLMEKSREVLAAHPVNQARVEKGLRPATQIWLWGQGLRPRVQTYGEKFGLSGVVVSAVDLVKGLGVLCGLEVPAVEGATGWIDTDCEKKVEAALEGLERHNFAYIHLEAPDEAGHQGDAIKKVHAIEMFDRRIVGPVFEALEKKGEPFRVLIAPDHPTPVATKTHTSEPVPYIYFDSERHRSDQGPRRYTEKDAASTGLVAKEGHKLWNEIVKGRHLVP